MSEFVIDAATLTTWQACRRRYLLNAAWHPRKWRPRSLFSSCLRSAIYSISNGADPRDAAKEARVRFMEVANNPGLDVIPGSDTYQLAKDYCAILDVIPRCLAKLILLTLNPAPDLELDTNIRWRTLAWADDSGQLHRWVFVDRVDADRIHSEAISWYVAGDVMLARMPMTLHMVEIGRMSKGRMRSPWTQAYFLPALRNGDYHFRAKSGAVLKGQWETKYLVDSLHEDVDEWSDRCWREGAAQSLVHHIEVKVPDEESCAKTTTMVRHESWEMRKAVEDQWARPWNAYAMSRAACDGPFIPCPFQNVCYSPQPVNIENNGLYIARQPAYSESNGSEGVLV